MQGMHSRFWIVAALIVLSPVSWGRAAQPLAEFNIPAQPLEAALLAFADQANVQVSVSTVTIAGIRTRGVSGRLTPAAALARLLAETGLRFNMVGERTYAVAASLAQDANASAAGATTLDFWQPGLMQFAQQSPIEAAPGVPSAPPVRAQEKVSEASTLGEVVVTGTHLREHAPVGAQIITIDRTDIQRLGLGTVTEVLRTLPQNFRGGPGDETNVGREAGSNFGFGGQSVNLRGLGAGATLVLVDGHRLSAGGSEGTFTDISGIPLSAIERIEVLTDGASAAYGSDAVGGVVNFILRRDYEGADTQLRAGTVTQGSMREYSVGQGLGGRFGAATSGVISYEYYQRDALPGSARDATSSSDLTRFGGTDYSQPFGNPGTVMVGEDTWAIPTDQDGTSLTGADLIPNAVNLQNRLEGRVILPETKRHSVFGTLRHEFTPAFALTLDGLFSRRTGWSSAGASGLEGFLVVPATNPFYVNPTGGTDPVVVAYNFIDDLGPLDVHFEGESHGAVLSAQIGLPYEWSLDVHANHSATYNRQDAFFIDTAAVGAALAETDPATALNAFGDGAFTNPATAETFRARSFYVSDSELRELRAVASGRLFALSSGEVRLAVGAERSRNSFEANNEIAALDFRRATSSERDATAVFGELLMPLYRSGEQAARRQLVELSLSSRLEDYSDYGQASTPRVGLSWSLAPGWALRGAWSKSFKAPNLVDLDEVINVSAIVPRPDPLSSTGSSPVLFWTGNNADLEAERATIWSAGLAFTPASMRAPAVSLTYFDIDFEGRIEPAPSGSYLEDPALAALVTRNPTQEHREAVCSRSTFRGAIADCLNRPIAAIIDVRIRNTAISRVAGLDLLASQAFDLSAGRLDIGLNSTYMRRYERQDSPLVPVVSVLNTQTNPMDLRARADISWTWGVWQLATAVNYQEGYRDELADRPVDSFTTLDARLSYSARATASEWLAGTRVALSAQNVFDTDPPFLDNPAGFYGYDPDNATILGRFVSLQINKSW